MNNPYFQTYGDCEKAWDEAIAARDKEWVEWGEDTCMHRRDGTSKSACFNCWQSRRKEIGI
jgi:hypothetical protein